MLLYLICDTGRSRIGVGSRGGAPGSSGVLGNKNCQMSMLLYLVVTLAGHEFAWGAQGFLGVKYLSDEHILTLFCDTGRSRIGVGSRGERKPINNGS